MTPLPLLAALCFTKLREYCANKNSLREGDVEGKNVMCEILDDMEEESASKSIFKVSESSQKLIGHQREEDEEVQEDSNL